MSFNLVLALAAKRVALDKSQTIACLDVSTAVLRAGMRDEVRIKMDADTLRLIREEQSPNVQPFDSEGFYKMDRALYGYRGSPRFWKDAVAEAATDLGLNETQQDRQFSVHGPRKLPSTRAS